ncbi:translation initiation factor IF-2 isoform X2 [Apis cerana]|uniref:translation initiation factor IF-2 isoform X2 n=1 Tax=Apis cerana TaxID=7461 RepID=UPI002B22B3D7|nr:translation initiation factor IF-2 isoform X2 [Apis cerana]
MTGAIDWLSHSIASCDHARIDRNFFSAYFSVVIDDYFNRFLLCFLSSFLFFSFFLFFFSPPFSPPPLPRSIKMDIRMLALVLLVNVVGSLADLRSPLFRPRRNGLREDIPITDHAGISRTSKRESTASSTETTASPVSTLHLYTLIPPDPTASPDPKTGHGPTSTAPRARASNTPKNMARRSTNEPDSTTEFPPGKSKSQSANIAPEDPSNDSRPKRPAPKPAGRSVAAKPTSPDPEDSEEPDPEPRRPDSRRAKAKDSEESDPEPEARTRGGKPRAKARPTDSEETDPEAEARTGGGKPRPKAKATDSEEEPSTRRVSNLERPKQKARPADSDEEDAEEPEERKRQPSGESRKAKRPKGKASSDQESEEADSTSKRPSGGRSGGRPAIGSRFDADDEEESRQKQKSKPGRIPTNAQSPNFQFPPFFMPSFVPGFSSPYTNPYSNAWAGSNAGSRGYGTGGAASFASASATAGASDIPSNYNAYPQGGYPGGYGDTSNMVNAPTPDVYDPSSFAFPDYNFADFQKQMEENFRQLQAQFQKQQQSLFDATNRIAGDPSSVPGLHSAVSSINLGPDGGYQAGAINPVRPGVESRFGEEVPPPSGNSYGVFSSSSSHTMVGPDGKTISHKSSTTGVNDNGKITFRTIED